MSEEDPIATYNERGLCARSGCGKPMSDIPFTFTFDGMLYTLFFCEEDTRFVQGHPNMEGLATDKGTPA